MYSLHLTASFVIILTASLHVEAIIPLVINTWDFQEANRQAWNALANNGSAIDAVVAGCSACERLQCEGTVGFGGSPDENGETTLDAMIMDGATMNVGAVASLRNIRDAISVARHVMDNTQHTLLVGNLATEFALQMGFPRQSLVTPTSAAIWSEWTARRCQPNFWINVQPNPREQCGPYQPISANEIPKYSNDRTAHKFDSWNHDTIGMIVIDRDLNIAAGTSTNGARHKIPGRVGDSPIPGSGSYADNQVGAAAATGDGDILMRFLPSLLAVEFMRSNIQPTVAARLALQRVHEHYPSFMGAVVAANRNGDYGAACYGIPTFPFSVYSESTGPVLETVQCMN